MSKSTLGAMPSPNNTNREGLFLRQTIVTRKQLLAMDADPTLREEEETSERGGRLDPRDHAGGGTIVGGPEREGKDRRRARGRDHIPSAEERNVNPEQNTDDDWQMADDDEMFDPLRAHLRGHGMSEDEVEQAIDVARRDVAQDRRRRMNGKDRLPERVDVQDRSDDKMPPRSGRFDRPRFSHDNFGTVDPANPDGKFLVDHGLDAEEAFAKRWPEIARIGYEPEPRDLSRDSRRRHAMDAKPAMTEARKQKIYQRYPGLERLDV